MKVPAPKSLALFPFLDDIKRYNFGFFRNDLFAAIAVALMTIPQSIAYSILAGFSPTAGLFSAIFGTIFASSFGSTRILITGPSTGTAILLQTATAQVLDTYYPSSGGFANEALVLHILTQFVVVMGLIQMGCAFFNVSKLLQFVSRPVILGYFAGITVAIAVTQSFSFTGIISPPRSGTMLFQAGYFILHINQIHFPTLAVGIVSLATLIFLKRTLKNFPNALFVLIIAVLMTKGFNHWFGITDIRTLGNFQLPTEPHPHMALPILDLALINKIFPAAIALSFLAILEVFSIARVFAPRIGQSLQINQDVFALGISNFILSFFVGAMPSSGSATRTTLNYKLQAKTRFAGILSGVITAIIIVFCWPLVKEVPLAALGALLIATVHTLMDLREIKFTVKATRADAWVFLFTFVSCLIFSLDVAFFIGIVISIGSYLKKTSTPHLVEYAFNTKGRLVVVSSKDDAHRKVRIIGIGGDLYFATADVFEYALETVTQDPSVQAIVLRLNNVHHMDASMSLAILRIYDVLKSTGRHLVVSGLTDEVWHVFHRAGVVKQMGLDNLYITDESNPQFSTWKACLRAQELVHGAGVAPYL